jgi:hypothetical protein
MTWTVTCEYGMRIYFSGIRFARHEDMPLSFKTAAVIQGLREGRIRGIG